MSDSSLGRCSTLALSSPEASSWLDVESIAGSILAVPDRLIVFCPTHASLRPCSPPSKVRPREAGHCGVVCATADLDGVCARRRSTSARSGRRNGCRIEQRNRQRCKHLSCQLFMVTICEGDSGRPSRSVLNNPGSSPQLPCSGLPAGRFEFTFTPKHGSWLNLVEGFFSKLARSILRHIRVASKQELKDRLWPPWTTSTTIRSFTHGPTSSTRPHDMIRTSETLT